MGYNTSGNIVKNFTIAEMANKQANEEIQLMLTPAVVEFAQMMQEFRDWYKKSMRVSSWYRTVAFNKKCGGASNSAHLDGRACDIIFGELTDEQFNNYAKKWENICMKHGKVGGVNRYDWGMHFTDYEDKFGHTHFTTRDKRTKVKPKKVKLSKK